MGLVSWVGYLHQAIQRSCEEMGCFHGIREGVDWLYHYMILAYMFVHHMHMFHAWGVTQEELM